MTENCSRNQVKLMRHIDENVVTLNNLRGFRDPTLFSLLRRGYLVTRGRAVVLSEHGGDVLVEYNSSEAPSRKRELDLTERTEDLLHSAQVLHSRAARRRGR